MIIDLKQIRKEWPSFTLEMPLQMDTDQITGLLGPNGSGKTTLMKILLGLLKADSVSGTVLGEEVDGLPVPDREDIGVVFADSGFSQVLDLREIRNICSRLYRQFDQTSWNEMLRLFELKEDIPLVKMSNGQRSLVKIMTALCHRAAFLVLDEPTNGLDVLKRNTVMNYLTGYIEKTRASVLISSHISSDLEHFADRIIILKEGRDLFGENMDRIEEDYGLIRVEEDRIQELDMDYILAREKKGYGYQLLTDQKRFYRENYPDLAIMDAGLDDIQLMLYGE